MYCQVWFVSKHDEVPHCVRLIDHAYSHTERQQSAEIRVDRMREEPALVLTDEAVMLDPRRNVIGRTCL